MSGFQTLHESRYVYRPGKSLDHEVAAIRGFARAASAGGGLQAERLRELAEAVANGATVASVYDRWVAEIVKAQGYSSARLLSDMQIGRHLPLSMWALALHAHAAHTVACLTGEHGGLAPMRGLIVAGPYDATWNAGGRSTVRIHAEEQTSFEPHAVFRLRLVVSVEVEADAYFAERFAERDPAKTWEWRVAPLRDGVALY